MAIWNYEEIAVSNLSHRRNCRSSSPSLTGCEFIITLNYNDHHEICVVEGSAANTTSPGAVISCNSWFPPH